MSKKIIHFRIPTIYKNGSILSAIPHQTMLDLIRLIKEKIGDNYEVISTPFDCTFEDSENLTNVDLDALSVEKFLEKYCKEDKL